METRPIAVLGGGNGGHCIAADLTLNGYRINFCELDSYYKQHFAPPFKTVLETGVLELVGPERQEQARIHKVTLDIAAALADVKLIIVASTAVGHQAFFNAMLPHLKDGQVVVLMPGNFDSLLLHKFLRERAPDKRVTIYETNTLSYGARMVGPGKVQMIYGPRNMSADLVAFPRVVSALPAKETGIALEEFQELFPVFSPAENILATAFSNPNYPGHPVMSLLNAGRIEYSRGDFYVYKEGFTPSVVRVMEIVYNEIARVAEAFGTRVAQLSQPFKLIISSVTRKVAGVKGPASLNERFITEDVPYGLVPISQLAEKVAVDIPLIEALIDLSVAVCGEDFRKSGRTLSALGLAELNKEQIISLVNG